MRFDTSSRNSRRDDYNQFVSFLGLNGNRNTVPMYKNNEVNNNSNFTAPCKNEKSLAMVYPVKQKWQRIYDPEIALQNGTVFEELDLPFYKSGCNGKCSEGCGRC